MKRFHPAFLILALASLLAAALAFSQSTNVNPDVDKNGRVIAPRPQPHLMYSPADLNHNGVTLPASGTTSTTSIVNMGGVTKSTLYVNCTQAVNVQVNTYKEDGVTIDGTYAVYNAVASGAQQIFIASELAPNATSGTLSINIRLPQKAFSFQEVNTTASAGTCTDRFIVGY